MKIDFEKSIVEVSNADGSVRQLPFASADAFREVRVGTQSMSMDSHGWAVLLFSFRTI